MDETEAIRRHGLMVETCECIERARAVVRISVLMEMLFSLEHELLLSRTETGLGAFA